TSVLAGPGKTVLHLRDGCGVLQASVRVEERPDDIEPANSRGPFEVERGAAAGEKFCRILASVGQTAVDEQGRISGAPGGGRSATCEEDVDQWVKHSGLLWVDAGCDQPQRRRSATVH